MIKKLALPILIVVLSYGFWLSKDVQTIAAGLAIFLYGMISLEKGFNAFTGGLIENILNVATDRLWKSFSFGVIATTLMQSSSLVSILTISFISSGLLGLRQGLGIIFGANLGTTTGAWLIAGFGLKVNISAYAMPMLVFGLLFLIQKSSYRKGTGYILLGIGFIFLGIHYIKEGFEAFRIGFELAQYAVGGVEGLIIYTVVGIIATVIMQSSHATLLLIITALSSAQVNYENAVAIAIGANVGTTFTAIMGAMGANVQGKRLALAHVIFNLLTGIATLLFIKQVTYCANLLASWLMISSDDYTLRLALFHTIFNLIGVFLLLPFVGILESQLVKWLPEKVSIEVDLSGKAELPVVRAYYLNPASVRYADTAISALRKESLVLFNSTFEVICYAIQLASADVKSSHSLEKIIKNSPMSQQQWTVEHVYQRFLKGIYSDIIRFVGDSRRYMTTEQGNQAIALMLAARHLIDAVKDAKHLSKNLIVYGLSDNKVAREQYDRLRFQIADVLRLINQNFELEASRKFLSQAEMIKLEIEKQDIATSGTLEKLIRNKAIDPFIASSLLNDNSYVYDICRHLVEGAVIAMSQGAAELLILKGEIELDRSELQEILKRAPR
ncbi:Na/Pi cotransporter family protein [Spartinivicinus ruber]|uniref:Na/Pi cotransporter family protein n=1 Tax=Spartinivicinus ruber TaxID=2683272 RepID=UPI0013D4E677|nr:Na/Pi symporter [Spartinivicinus ruber]